LQESVKALVMSVISGQSLDGCFARLDPDGSWVKMSQGFYQQQMAGFSEEYCGTWPKWGTLSAGVAGVPVTWVRPTIGKEFSSWPTVRAGGNRNSRNAITGANTDGKHKSDMGLEQAVEAEGGVLPRELVSTQELPPRFRNAWPMLRTSSSTGSSHHGDGGADLQAAGMWATPNTLDSLPPKSPSAIQREMTVARPGRSAPANLRDQIANNWPTPKALWRTPGAEDGGRRGEYATYEAYKERIDRGGQINLAHQVKFPQLWATPAAQDGKNSTLPPSQEQRDALPGNVLSEMRATPGAGACGMTAKTSGRPIKKSTKIQTQVHLAENMSGVLNPAWVEILQGFPPGWTSPAGQPDEDKSSILGNPRE